MWLWRSVVKSPDPCSYSNDVRQMLSPIIGVKQYFSLQMKLQRTPSFGSGLTRSKHRQNQKRSGGRNGGTRSRTNF
jgi:hypothetical protein